MNKVKYRLTLDLEKPGIQHTIYAKKMDSASREVIFTLRDGSKPYVLTDDVQAYMYALAGSAEIFTDCEINNNSIIAPITTNILAADSIFLELRLTTAQGAVLASPQIKVVSEDVLYSEEAMQAKDDFSALIAAIAKAESAKIEEITVNGEYAIFHYKDGTEVALKFDTVEGPPGDPGKSAYQEWLSLGNEGDEQDFIDSLSGRGILNIAYTRTDGLVKIYTVYYTDGTQSYIAVSNGESAYHIWLNEGHEGTEADFLEWLKADSVPFEVGETLELTGDNVLNVKTTEEANTNSKLPITSSGAAKLADKLRDEMPAKTSQLTNDSEFITKAVADLVNYYTKSQSYTKDEVNALISAIPKFTISVVSSLPTANISTTTVYLVKTGTEGDLYTEWIYVDGKWEVLGSQRVDLTGYATEVYVQDYAQPKGNYALKSEIPDVPVKSVNGKTGAVTLDAEDVGARADNWMPTAEQVGAMPAGTKIPSKVSELENDSKYLTGYTETDPTVPSWAKQPNKPSYSKSEVGLSNVDNVKQYSASNPPPYPVTSVNGKTGDVTIDVPDVIDKANKSDAETWTFTLEDGSVVTKKVVLA